MQRLQNQNEENFLPTAEFLPAFEAEALLGVSVAIIKHLPPGFLLPNWPAYFKTFKAYLGHQASTVRQAASVVFKHIMARDSSNPIMVKLILQGLAAFWTVSPDLETAFDDDKLLPWEQREGRLLAYELVLRYLIVNHVHYLFPDALLSGPYNMSQRDLDSPLHNKRRYVSCIPCYIG